ncbi:MAG: ACT domain-containing protein, partial [Microbacteriaceae bacterium]
EKQLHEHDEARSTALNLGGVPDVPGKAAQIFEIVAGTNANIDMIVQNVSPADTNRTDISFTIPVADGRKVIDVLNKNQAEVGYEAVNYDDQIAKIAVVGAGMRTSAGVSAQLFRALYDAGINIEMISTSEIRISVVTRADLLDDAVRVLHTAFGLDADHDATVYAGTGR